MASEKEDTEKYLNWIKTSLSLLILKEGLVEEINEQADNLHDNVKQLVQTKYPNAITTTCKYCTSKSIKKAKKTTPAGTHWFVNCRSNVCNHWLDALLVFHEHLPSPNVEWVNCNPTLWPSQPWEVAKVFQPYGCEHHKHAGDSDVAALLTFMLDCKYINKNLSNKQILREIKDCRNQIMHSAKLEIDDANMLQWHNDMIALLTDKKRLGQLPSCQAAADKIRERRDKPIKLSFDKEEENTALSLQISTLTAEISNIQLTSDELRCDLNEQTKKSQRSSEECEQIRQDLTSTGAAIAQIQRDIGALQLSLGDTDLPQLQGKVFVLQQHLQSLSEQNKQDKTELEDRISVIESDIDVMKAQMKSHTSEIASLQQEQVRGKEIDVVGIQQHLISLYNRSRQRVPIYPLRPEWRKHVADLFVTPSMTVMNPHGIHVQQTFHHKGLASHGESTQTRVESIRDIFYNGNTLCRDIVIAGDSGNGKSVLCEYLVNLWVRVHSSDVQNLAEEKFMEIFTFLFYISLREASRHPLQSNDVERMIQSQLNLEHVDLSKLILDHTCLIILDGLDEFSQSQTSRNTRFGSSNLPERPLSENSTVLTTSRPWKLELLAIELEGKIDRMISLRGIEKKSQGDLVENIVTLLNSQYHGRDKKSQHFFDEIKDKNLAQYLKTPVLLTQMLGLWYSGESFGRSQCSIYSAMINKQLQFTAKVKQRGLPTELQKKEQTESKTTGQDQLPTCFTDQAYCQKHKSLLLKLSRLAYECLFSKNKENSLVFDHQQMEICGMSKDEIQTSLHMGLVTQYKVFGEITQRLRSISFIHKSHQEFFAAVYLSQVARASDLKQLLESFSDLDRVLEIEKVFTFVSGMSPKVSCEIAKVIMDKASEKFSVQQYRQSCTFYDAPHEDLVKQIQGVILAGIEEGKIHGQKITGIQLQDLWMKNEDRDFPPSRVLACTQSLELSHVKSIFIRTPGDDSQDQIWRLIKASRNLHKIVLLGCDISVDKIQKVVRRNPGTLQALGLYYYKRDFVDFSRLGRNDLKKILSAPKSSLGLHGVILTHAQLKFLCRHLSECSYSEVILGKLRCTTHGDRAEDCKQRVDLSASKNISRLELDKLPVQEVVFIPENLVRCVIANLPETVATNAIRCLSNAVKLEKFQCWGLRDSALVELARTLPLLLNLKHIGLTDINLSGHEAVLCTPDMKQLEVIFLYRVTVTSGHLQSLLSTIPSHRVEVYLGDSKLGPLTITSYSRTNDILQQIRDNPNTPVTKDEVEYEGDKCVVKQFWFYTSK